MNNRSEIADAALRELENCSTPPEDFDPFASVEQYVTDSLSEAERDAFEFELLDNTRLQNEVAVVEAMRTELRRQSSDLSERPSAAPAPQSPRWPMGIAATLIAGLSFTLFNTHSALQVAREQLSEPSSVAALVTLEATRGEDALTRVETNGRAVVLAIDVGPGLVVEYAATVITPSGRIYTIPALQRDEQYRVNLTLGRAEKGTYRVTLTANDADAGELSYGVVIE